MKKILYLIMVLVLSAGACNFIANGATTPTPAKGLNVTQMAQTVAVRLTQMSSFATPTPGIIQPTPVVPVIVTATSQNNNPAAPSQTPMVIVPSETAAAAAPSKTPKVVTQTPSRTATKTPVPQPCNEAQFLGDVSIKDWTVLMPGAHFTKTWRVKNIGTCAWGSNYALAFSSGNGMGASGYVQFGVVVRPGETVDLSNSMVAPGKSGNYEGYWVLKSNTGEVFGVGHADTPLWVKIKVSGYKSDGLPDDKRFPYDFVYSLCDAAWTSSSGNVMTPCDSSSVDSSAWVSVMNNPKLEGGRTEDEPSLRMRPVQSDGGWLQGTYPSYTVKSGDHFYALVGCLYNNKSCDATFSLKYKYNGSVHTLETWTEVYDDEYTAAQFDLDELVGKKVQFILRVTSHTNSLSDLFWVAPGVRRAAAPTATPKSNMPTIAPTLPPAPTAPATPAPTSNVPGPTPAPDGSGNVHN
jgi:hypothetical protein